MQLHELRHQSDSRYCFSLGKNRVKVRLAVARSLHLQEVELIYGDTCLFYKERTRVKMELKHHDPAFFYYEAVMEQAIPRFFYIFSVKEAGETWVYSETGLGKTFDYSLSIMSAFQFNGENENDVVLDKPSWQGRVFYQVFPERFASREDPKKKPYVDTPWTCFDLRGKNNAFLGGDLWGVVDKLDYLKSIGVGALYLTPIHPSPSNHKYDIMDYFDVDASFGGKEAFRAVVEGCHSRGMKIMMDLVFNHFSANHPFFKDVCEKGKDSPYYDWFFIDGDYPIKKPLNYRTFAFVSNMPKVNTNKKEVQDYLISIGEYWMKEFAVDGFRLDVSEGVSHDFWTRFKIALKAIDPEVLLLGENWLNSESFLGPNQLDGVMNYPFLVATSSYVLGIDDAKTASDKLDGLLMRYKDGHDAMMLNILSSHDIQRFKTLCHGDADLSLLGYAMMVFFPGYPMIYYGEEIFMEGHGDPDNRQGMRWNSPEWEGTRHQIFKSLLLLRQNPALLRGECSIYDEDRMLVIARNEQGKTLKLFCNLSESPKTLPRLPILSNLLDGNLLLPRGFAVVYEE